VLALIREPLAHFLVIGAAIFALYGLIADRPAADARNRIEITTGDIEQLRATFVNKWQRPPTADELKGLIETQIRETVLYREALAMGLENDDTIIKSRLAQKLEFLTQDITAARKSTDADLAAFFAAHRERYLVPERLSFSQLYFNTSERSSAQDDAQRVLAQLRGGSVDRASARLGDQTLLEDRYSDKTPQEIDQLFGRDFVKTLLAVSGTEWQGPIASAYGWHLVRIEQRVPSHAPAFADVREQVERDWLYEQQQQANEAVYRQLRKRYDIVVAGEAQQYFDFATGEARQGAAP
jgi:hypothetical protein